MRIIAAPVVATTSTKSSPPVLGMGRYDYAVVAHELTHHPQGGRPYSDTVTLIHVKPIVIPPPPHLHHGHHPPKPPYHGWAGVWSGYRWGFITFVDMDASQGYTFGDYVTDPDAEDCAPSPFYYYPDLPPYIPDRCYNGVAKDSGADATGSIPANLPAELNLALQDLVKVWQDRDKDALARLLPSDGEVVVHVEGGEAYNLDSKDFVDLFKDGVMNSDTKAYQIEGVKQLESGKYLVYAAHTFDDPWGQARTIDHKYVFALEHGAYVIREFRSSTYR